MGLIEEVATAIALHVILETCGRIIDVRVNNWQQRREAEGPQDHSVVNKVRPLQVFQIRLKNVSQ
jgi:hypothetical protein